MLSALITRMKQWLRSGNLTIDNTGQDQDETRLDYFNKKLEAITIEILPDEAVNPGLHKCWQLVIYALGYEPFRVFKTALEQLETTYDYSKEGLIIEVYEFTNSPMDIATVRGLTGHDEYHCQIGELIALMKRTVEIYESQYGEE